MLLGPKNPEKVIKLNREKLFLEGHFANFFTFEFDHECHRNLFKRELFWKEMIQKIPILKKSGIWDVVFVIPQKSHPKATSGHCLSFEQSLGVIRRRLQFLKRRLDNNILSLTHSVAVLDCCQRGRTSLGRLFIFVFLELFNLIDDC